MDNSSIKKLNILLVNPSYAAAYGKMNFPVQIHLGLAYLAAVMEREKHNVEIIDLDAEGLGPDDFVRIIKNKRYDIAGFTVTTPTFFSGVELAELVKKNSPDTLVVFGGIHATIRPQEIMKLDCVDIGVRGEGEMTFKEIGASVGNGRDFSGINGLLYKRNGEIIETAARPPVDDLDTIPFPARHLFKDKRYTYPDALYPETVPIFTSRGCPGRCTFCNTFQVFTRAFRARSPENVVDEIESLVKEKNIKEIHIWDDNFTTIKRRVFEIRDEIIRRKLKVKFAFPNGIRVDCLNEKILEALKEMGTYSIAVGVESGSQEVLDRAHKGIKLRRVEETIALAKNIGLETWAFFVLGLPGESVDTIKKTISFARKLDPDIAKFHLLKPYPGTEVYDYLSKKNFILTEDYNQFGMHTPPIHRIESLTPSDLLKWQKKAYQSFYLNPRKIVKQLFRVKTLNRFWLNVQAGKGLVKLTLSKG